MVLPKSTQRYVISSRYTGLAEEPGRLLLTYQQSELFKLINYVFFCTLICLFGIGANAINIVIFFKQGFSYTVNISFCGLAISDLCCLLTELWFDICMSPFLRQADISFVSDEVQYLTGSVPSLCFGRITGWITVFITVERCLGIALPLKVKQIITQKKITAIISVIYVVNIVPIIPEYQNFYLDWKFFPDRNKTLFGLIKNSPDEGRNIVGYVLTALIGYTSFIVLIIATVILVIKLGQKSTWRKTVTRANEQSESMASRDKKTVKMIVLIASVMIVCYTPGTVLALYMIIEPQFSIMGSHQNAFFAIWSFAFVFQNINSSVNIFLYYTMSTKYRQTFQELFVSCVYHASPKPEH